jgi:hypothetical protein
MSTERLSRSKKRGERGLCTLVLCRLATSCINASVRIVTKSPKVGPLLVFSISLENAEKFKGLDLEIQYITNISTKIDSVRSK